MFGTESIIQQVCMAHRTNYGRRGRTMEPLGVGHLGDSELTRYVTGKTKHSTPLDIHHPKLSRISISRAETAHKQYVSGLHEKLQFYN